jgi:DNA mismatch endonuclease (patch repair protein)
MARIRARGNATTERNLTQAFRRLKIVGWRRHLATFGRPDFTFRKQRVVVFVDGCFWHGCPKHGRNPKSNTAYWLPKLARNRTRDSLVSRHYRARGWKVLRLWEHDAESAPLRCACRIAAALNRDASKM